MKISHGIIILLLVHFFSCEKITVSEIEKQVFTLSEDTIIIREGQTKTINLSLNVGQSRCRIINTANWLYVSPSDDYVSADYEVQFSLSVNTNVTNYPASTTFLIETEKESFKVYVVALSANPVFVSPYDIHLNPELPKAEVYISNPGIEKFTWNTSAVPSFLSLNQTSGELNSFSLFTLHVTLDTSAIPADIDTTFDLEITINQLKKEKVIINIQTFKPGLKLDQDVVEGVYSAKNQKFYYVSSKPKGINCIDLKTLEKKFVGLSYTPICLSLSPDEKKAAIGHDAKVSYFDILSMQKIAEFDVDCKAIDIILAPNDYIYVFPDGYQGNYLRCLNTTTGKQECEPKNYLYAGASGDLHPNGKWIYFGTKGISPGDIHKVDISQGTTEYLYDSPYHGGYNIGGYARIKPDGKKILTGNIFVSSDTNKTNDLLYRGTFDGIPEWTNALITPGDVYFHEASDEVYIVMETREWSDFKPEYIYRYHVNSPELISKIKLIPIVNKTGQAEAAFAKNVWIHQNKMYHIVHTKDKEVWELRNKPL